MAFAKQSREEKADKLLVGEIKKGMEIYNVSQQELAAALCMCENSLRSRMKAPGTFTKRELEALKRKLHIDTQTLLECIA